MAMSKKNWDLASTLSTLKKANNTVVTRSALKNSENCSSFTARLCMVGFVSGLLVLRIL